MKTQYNKFSTQSFRKTILCSLLAIVAILGEVSCSGHDNTEDNTITDEMRMEWQQLSTW